MRQDLKIYVVELVIMESGSYSDQFMRPYKTELKGGMIDKIQERYEKARRFTPAMLASIANQFMVPDARARGVIEIPHGWNERRGRFILTIEIKMGTGGAIRQVIMGYTNSVGFTISKVDHDMEFFINNMFVLTERQVETRNGWRTEYHPSHMNDVLSDRDNAGLRNRSDRRYTIRPEDIFSTIDASQSHALVDDLTDIRITLNKGAIKSRMSNRIGSRYMSSVLQSRHKALDNNSEYGHTSVDSNTTAQGYIQESYASDDVFLQAISNLRDLSRTVDNFTMRDLLDIDPEADRRMTLNKFDEDGLGRTRYSSQEINRLDGGEEEDRVAALIAAAIPALMFELGIHSIRCQVHNQGIGHAFEFEVISAESLIQGMQIGPMVDRFEDRLIDELLTPITADNRFDIGIKLTCRVFGEIDFDLFWDGKNRGRYVLPCFCNSLSSPIITDDIHDVKNATRDFTSLFDEILPDSIIGRNDSSKDYGY